MSSNHCVIDCRHIPRLILILHWSQSDNNNNNNNNNNSAKFVRLLNTNPISSGSLSVTWNITDGNILKSRIKVSYPDDQNYPFPSLL